MELTAFILALFRREVLAVFAVVLIANWIIANAWMVAAVVGAAVVMLGVALWFASRRKLTADELDRLDAEGIARWRAERQQRGRNTQSLRKSIIEKLPCNMKINNRAGRLANPDLIHRD